MLSVLATALLLETCSSVTGPPGPQPLLGCRPCPAVARKLGGGWTQWAPTSSLPGAPASVHTHAPLSASGVGQLRPPPLAGSAGGPDQRFQCAPVDLASVARLSLRAPDRRHAPAVVTGSHSGLRFAVIEGPKKSQRRAESLALRRAGAGGSRDVPSRPEWVQRLVCCQSRPGCRRGPQRALGLGFSRGAVGRVWGWVGAILCGGPHPGRPAPVGGQG